MPSQKVDFFQNIQETIIYGVHGLEFKNGAFIDKMGLDIDPFLALNIMMESSLLDNKEKDIIGVFGEKYMDIVEAVEGDEGQIDYDTHIAPIIDDLLLLQQVFARDAEARGKFIPPAILSDEKETRILYADGEIVSIPWGASDAKTNVIVEALEGSKARGFAARQRQRKSEDDGKPRHVDIYKCRVEDFYIGGFSKTPVSTIKQTMPVEHKLARRSFLPQYVWE